MYNVQSTMYNEQKRKQQKKVKYKYTQEMIDRLKQIAKIVIVVPDKKVVKRKAIKSLDKKL